MKVVVAADSLKSGVKNGKTWRQQRVLAHQPDGQVKLLSVFLFEQDKPLEPGEYSVDFDKVCYIGDVIRVDKKTGQLRTENGFVVPLRVDTFVRSPAVPGAKPRAA